MLSVLYNSSRGDSWLWSSCGKCWPGVIMEELGLGLRQAGAVLSSPGIFDYVQQLRRRCAEEQQGGTDPDQSGNPLALQLLDLD